MNYEIISLDHCSELVQLVAEYFSKQVIIPKIQFFADGEMRVIFDQPEQFKDKQIVLIQSTSNVVNEHVLQVAFLLHELKNAGARHIIGVFPYFGYSRQEKSYIKGKSGPAYVITKLFEQAGLDEVITFDIHTQKIADFFSIPFVNMVTNNLIVDHIVRTFSSLQDTCLIAPDTGVQERVKGIAKKLNIDTLIFTKERFAADKTRVIGKVGTCTGHTAIIIDDILDTGGTALNVCNELIKSGFKKVYGYFTHAVFSGNALEHIENSSFEKIFVSNTIPLQCKSDKVEAFDISTLLTDALKSKL